LVQFVPRWAHLLDVSGLRWCGVRAASDGTWARSSARFANIAPTMMSWLGLRSCGPSSPHQLSESRPCIWRRPYIDPTEPAGGRRRRTDREEGHPRNAVCEPPTYTHRVLNPLCYSSIQGETIPFPKLAAASRRAGIRCAGLSGPPRPSPGARPRRAGRGRPRRRVLHAQAHAVQWHSERRVLLNGNVVVFRW